MHRPTALALVAVLWAAIYLPGLGSTELKGEEGRRILPAVTMLETGNWLVPYVGGKPYLRKPPLVNWAIAGMFKITGVRNEWTARLPAALCVLALGLGIVAVASDRRAFPTQWLDVETSLVAALMAMTQFGLLAKAKFAGAEIEGIYAPLTGIAIVCWLAWHAQGRSPWLVWTVPGVLLGLACLTKGPSLHLVFFYGIVGVALWRENALRQLWHPAPFAGLAICAGIFAAWAVPYFQTPEAATAAEVWKRQGIDRFTDSEFNARNYFTNIPRALGDLLPWVLLVPVALAKRRGDVGRGPLDGLRAVALATAGCFLVILLIPGTLPRYVLPLGVPVALLLASALRGADERTRAIRYWHGANRGVAALLILAACAAPFVVSTSQRGPGGPPPDFSQVVKAALLCLPLIPLAAIIIARRARALRPSMLATATATLLGIGAALYAIAALPWILRSDDLRPVARAIDAAIPVGERLTLYNPGFLAAIFYLRTPSSYAPQTEDIPADAPWVLARGGEREKLAKKRPDLRVAREISLKTGPPLLLLQRADRTQKVAVP